MSDQERYREHLETLERYLDDALRRAHKAAGSELDALLFHSGRERAYHADDEVIPFRETPHFRRWVPLAGPDHLVLARPGKRPLVVRCAPKDFWYETVELEGSWWQAEVELHEVERLEQALPLLGSLERCAYVGSAPEAAAELGIPEERVEPAPLMAVLDWHRATKTRHEVALMQEAVVRAAEGHRIARKAFEGDGSEREIHWAYLQATGHLERELPFPTIPARGAKIATLHYQNKRGNDSRGSASFMLDAGATFEGYASDITRTWYSNAAPELYRALVDAVDALERDLVAMVTPGRDYVEIHLEAHRRVGALLTELGVLRCSAEEAYESGLTRTFLPHGVGHHLGIQVHDVGGRQAAPEGGTKPPPEGHAFLRNTRRLEPGHVVTIEPGVYFTPVLLEELRQSPAGAKVDWELVAALSEQGGVRIEDDVLCTEEGARDLSRPHIQGPRGT